MLSDLVQALKLLLSVFQSERTPERKRQRFARRLLTIYRQLLDVTERGRELMDLFNGDEAWSQDTAIDILLAQQEALSNLTLSLQDDSIVSVLDLHLPELRHLQVLINSKKGRIDFYLAQFTSDESLYKLEDSWADAYIDLITGRQKKLELADWEMDEQIYPTVKKSMLTGSPKKQKSLKELKIDELIEELPLSKRAAAQENGIFVTIRSTAKDMSEARRALEQLSDLAEQLRVLLLEKFKFEDVL